MDPVKAGERGPTGSRPEPDVEAIEFVRFCHHRRRVGWPELYDEMCAVAGRGLYRGYGQDDLAAIGIGFGLFQMPALAGLVARVVEEDHDRRRRTAAALQATAAALQASVALGDASLVTDARSGSQDSPLDRPRQGSGDVTDGSPPERGSIRIAVPAGA
ncbi:MAG TPA: hypothetical protein VM427_00615 [Patescibacteria group bacterium]|nr:hypothetical protein [Patescibacteria group bacterium]